METGIISTLIKNCKINGEIKADYITFEVDESYVPKIFNILFIVFKKIIKIAFFIFVSSFHFVCI